MSDTLPATNRWPPFGIVVAGILLALALTFCSMVTWAAIKIFSPFITDIAVEIGDPNRPAGALGIWLVAMGLIKLCSFSDQTKKVAYIAASVIPVLLLVSFYNASDADCMRSVRAESYLQAKRRDLIIAWAPCLDDPLSSACEESQYQDSSEVVRQLVKIEQRLAARKYRLSEACAL